MADMGAMFLAVAGPRPDAPPHEAEPGILAALRAATFVQIDKTALTVAWGGDYVARSYHMLSRPSLLAILAFVAENSAPYRRVETDTAP
jgi:hypothetical protein